MYSSALATFITKCSNKSVISDSVRAPEHASPEGAEGKGAQTPRPVARGRHRAKRTAPHLEWTATVIAGTHSYDRGSR